MTSKLILLLSLSLLPLIVILLAIDNGDTSVNAFTGANITDGESRLAIIQEEDFSISVYETINGTTEQIAGFEGTADQELNKELLQLQRVIHQLTVTIKELIQTLQQTLSVSVNSVYATSMIIDDPSSDKNSQITFNATFLNGTTANYNGNQTEQKTNILIAFINGLVDGTIDAEALEELVPPLPEEEEPETTESEESDGGGSDESNDPIEADPSQGNPDDSGNGTGDEGGDFDDSVEESVEPVPEPEPEPEPQNTTCMIHPYCGDVEVPTESI